MTERPTSSNGDRRKAVPTTPPAPPPAQPAPDIEIQRPARIRFTDRLRGHGRQER